MQVKYFNEIIKYDLRVPEKTHSFYHRTFCEAAGSSAHWNRTLVDIYQYDVEEKIKRDKKNEIEIEKERLVTANNIILEVQRDITNLKFDVHKTGEDATARFTNQETVVV